MTYSGNVIRWSSKGFGFVECDSLDQELFVHHSEFGGGELVEGKSISFDIGDDSRTGKKMAINVTGPAITERRPSPRRRRYPSDDRRRGHSPPRRRYDSRDRYERNRYRSRSPRDRRLQQTRYDSRERDYRMGSEDRQTMTDAEKADQRMKAENEAWWADFWLWCCCDPNGDGEGKPTCMCRISCANWAIIISLFLVYYTLIGLFFYGMIEAMFVVVKSPSPADRDALKILSPVV